MRVVVLALGLAGGVALGGQCFGLQALLFLLQRLGCLLALLQDVFSAFARLYFARGGARRAGAVGVGDLAGARVGAAHHLR